MADSAPTSMGAYASKIVWGSNGEPVAPGSPDDSPFFDLRIRVVLAEGATAPEFKSAAAAGMDLCACENVALEPGVPTKVNTGVAMELPFMLYGQVAGRSSVAAKGIATFPGVIDSDYRGEIKVLLTNHTGAPHLVAAGDRIAQLLVLPIARPMVDVVQELSVTVRGEGGFGSTDDAAGAP